MVRPLPRHRETAELVEITECGRALKLHPDTWAVWQKLKQQAASVGVELYIVSAFRSVARQAEIIARKRAQGLSDQEIYIYSAPPGYSEHHTGRALDLNTPGCPPLEEAFAQTAAFTWLSDNAALFGFHLSYPRDNPYGLGYEPWHWFWTGFATSHL
jgi:D-alanyl-D-alanine carboxypeptidase